MCNFIQRLIFRDTRTANQQATDGHLGISPFKLRCMSNGELAQWHANHQNEPSKRILAEQEWQNRRLSKQIHTSYFVAIIGVIGSLAGVVLGWHLRSSNNADIAQSKYPERTEWSQQQKSSVEEVHQETTPSLSVQQPNPRENSARTKKQQINKTINP